MIFKAFPKFTARILALSIILTLALACGISAEQWTKDLAKGVTLTQIVESQSGRDDTTVPRVINVLKVDPKEPGVQIKSVLGGDRVWDLDPTKGRETIGSIAKRLNAIAVINGDYCNWTGDPLGLHIGGGELISEPYPNRTVFGMTSDGKCLFDRLEFDARIMLADGNWFPIRGINRPRKENELVAYTSRFFTSTCTPSEGSEAVVTTTDLPVRLGVPIKGTITTVNPDRGDTAIPDRAIVLSGAGTGSDFVKENLREGTPVTIEFNVKGSDTTGWEKVVEAVCGTPRLIRAGKISVEIDQEKLKQAFYGVTHPRTAVGVTADEKLVLVTVDGRQSISTGMPLADLAEFMLSQGCVEALNLDGGGSTTMATSFGVLNSPSDGTLRALPNAIAVFAEESSSPSDVPEFTISPPPGPLKSGANVQLALLDASSGRALKPDLTKQAIWSMNGRTNFVDQSGKLYGVKAGQTEVVVRLGSRIASIPIEAIPGSAYKLAARLDPDPADVLNRSTLTATVTDLNGNAIRDKQVTVKVTGGAPDEEDLLTAGDGKASTGVTWDAASGSPAEVKVTASGFPAAVLQRPK